MLQILNQNLGNWIVRFCKILNHNTIQITIPLYYTSYKFWIINDIVAHKNPNNVGHILRVFAFEFNCEVLELKLSITSYY